MADRPPHGNVSAQGLAVRRAFRLAGEALSWWTRLEFEAPGEIIPGPALLVANHGFGGIFDPNAWTLATVFARLGAPDDAPLTVLTHELAFKSGLGPVLEPAGFRPASWEAALEAFDAGEYVLVMPGGDLDAGKSFRHRNEIIFGGRTGFARLAIQAGVPIVPIVVSGAGETLLVLTDGQRVARWLRLPELIRMKTVPVSISVPWGLSVWLAGMVPYLPLPAKMRASVLDPITPEEGEDPVALADRVHEVMSTKLTEMTAGRVPFLGMRWDAVIRRRRD